MFRDIRAPLDAYNVHKHHSALNRYWSPNRWGPAFDDRTSGTRGGTDDGKPPARPVQARNADAPSWRPDEDTLEGLQRDRKGHSAKTPAGNETSLPAGAYQILTSPPADP